MTCGHCVSSVSEELGTLDGVESVEVDLNAGSVSRVTLTSQSALDVEAVRAAVNEAGYSLEDA
jgi:copper chaperone CopZ